MEKMGQRTKSTRPGLPHTGRPHGRVPLTSLDHDLKQSHMGVSHGHVPAEPKFSPIRKRPILRALRHSKAYKYTLEEEKRGDVEEESRNCSRKADRSISKAEFTIKTEDLPSNSLRIFGILIQVKLLFRGGIDPV
ncbi:D-amino acid dehydrogenase small subunit [Gossypium arboreum]|uniref:D-amino acid dehydrogenase small subunit n=1 Tax=Gossypium arboreum TaxID=29729 RepID=A0A0B0PYR0_GOSAR|nr:D-amino acid dehydrogenase small subunit [Gossypium arboreum]